ncbi:MAG: group I truncated hemoglobin [Blastocatellia bacterium]
MRNIRTFILSLCVLTAFSVSALAQQKSLYERLGGEEGISAVVDDFAQNVLADSRINKKFAKSDAPRLLTNLKAFVCFATGGPCRYTGLDMKTSHKNMGVTAGEFTALVEDLVKTLDKFRVPAKEKNELLGALAALRKDIVEIESPATGRELPAAFKPAPPLAAVASAPAQQKSLYERLGGKDAISAVVDDFAQNVLTDSRINKKFAKSDAPRLLANLKDFVCFATGGPCRYTGLDMKTSHKNMGTTAGEFNALVEDLVKTLDKFKVPAKEKNELLGALAGLRGDIVESESSTTGGELPAAFTPAPPLGTVASAPAPAQQKSLYERLGGKDAISAVVDDFAQNVLTDPRINKKFAKSDAPRLLTNLKAFVCFATGGPCRYTGLDMKTSHKNMGTTAGEFTALVEDLVKTLDKFKVPEKEKNELLGALAGLRGDIVESESSATGGELPAAFQPAPPLGESRATVASTPAPARTPATPVRRGGSSLYERLGGKEAISAVVDDFAQNVLTDPRINKKFVKSDPVRLVSNLKDFVCVATGGPCQYFGLDMKKSHKRMDVTAGEFNALVEDLVKTLDKFKVPEKEKNELLGALAGLRGDIVENESSAVGGELPKKFKPAPPMGSSKGKKAMKNAKKR